MVSTLKLGEIAVEVIKKDIKNVHLSVYPPAGRVRISAPLRMRDETVRVFAISKLGWIKQQQRKLARQEREAPREYVERESHYLWGKRYLLKVIEWDAPPLVELRHKTIILHISPERNRERRQAILDEWYRRLLKAAVQPLVAKWQPVIGVKVDRVFVQRMKTKWGSCSRVSNSIRLNTELAKKPVECLEYIVVHEMAHGIEPTHSRRFLDMMDRLMPNWRICRDHLNRLPVRHEDWSC